MGYSLVAQCVYELTITWKITEEKLFYQTLNEQLSAGFELVTLHDFKYTYYSQ